MLDRRPLMMTTLQYAALAFAIKVKNKKGWESLPPLLIQAICGRLMTASPYKAVRGLVEGDWIKFDQSLDGYVIDEGSLPSHPQRLIGPRAPELDYKEAKCLLSHWDAGERVLGEIHFVTMNTKTAYQPAAKIEPPKISQPPTPLVSPIVSPAPVAIKPHQPKPPASPALVVSKPPQPKPPTKAVVVPPPRPEASMSTSNEEIQLPPGIYRAVQVIIEFAASRPGNKFTTAELLPAYEAAGMQSDIKNVMFTLKRAGLLVVVGGKLKSMTDPSQYRLAYGKKYFRGSWPPVELIEPASNSAPKPPEPPPAASDDPPPPQAPGDAPPAPPVPTASPEPQPAPSSMAQLLAAIACESDAPATVPLVEGAIVPATLADQPPLCQEDAELLEDLQTELDQLNMTITGLEADLELALRDQAPKWRRLRMLEAVWASHKKKFAGTSFGMRYGIECKIASDLNDRQMIRIAAIESLKADVNTPVIEELRIRLGATKVTRDLIIDAIADVGKPSTG